jgi:hypothetical protein
MTLDIFISATGISILTCFSAAAAITRIARILAKACNPAVATLPGMRNLVL